MSQRPVNWNLNFRQRSYQSYHVAMSGPGECHIMAPPDHWHTRVLDTDQCQVHVGPGAALMTHTTPLMDRRHHHRYTGQSGPAYPREYDVSSIVSEADQLSLYSTSSRKHSLVNVTEDSGHHTRRRHRSGRGQDSHEEPRGSGVTKSEPPSPGHSCYSAAASPGHSYSSETRGAGDTWADEATAGCCSLQPSHGATDYDSLISGHGLPSKEPILSNCVKNFMSWMAEKAEKGTNAFLESLPSLSKEDFHIVMIGLDGAGKTTALYRLKFDQYMNTVPTVGFNCERVKGTVGKSRGLTFLIWDVGGQEKIRPLWRSYTRCTDGIIFVVDSAEADKLDEAKVELWRTMKYQDNKDIPLLILANKQDLQSALSAADIEDALGLHELNSQLWSVEESCSVTGEGLDTGLEALCQLIARRRKLAKRKRNKTK